MHISLLFLFQKVVFAKLDSFVFPNKNNWKWKSIPTNKTIRKYRFYYGVYSLNKYCTNCNY